jgi:hypothetical protein
MTHLDTNRNPQSEAQRRHQHGKLRPQGWRPPWWQRLLAWLRRAA